MHLPLVAGASILGFFGGAILGTQVLKILLSGLPIFEIKDRFAPLILGIPCFFGGAILGLKALSSLVIRLVPANCPRCYGRTYFVSGKQITYRCASCGYVQKVPIYSR